jgi:hypothetical protein
MVNGHAWTKLAALGAATVVGVASTSVQAQEEMAVNDGAVSFAASVDITTAYYFRGYLQEDQGLIVQPDASATFALSDDLGVYIGSWSSFHSEQTGATGSGPDIWYEADIYGGVTYTGLDLVTLDAAYVVYTSPNGAFDDIQELDFYVEFDDSEYLNDWALTPYALVAIEIDDDNGSEDTYLELGGALALPFEVGTEDYPIALSVPIAVGLSLDDYYVDASGDDEFFGYLSIGVGADTALPFIPSEYGAYSAGVSVTGLFLNDDAGLSDDDFELVGTLSIGMEY